MQQNLSGMWKLEQVKTQAAKLLGAHDPEIRAMPSGELEVAHRSSVLMVTSFQEYCQLVHFPLLA